jgi:hypothetical protein
MPHAAWLEEQRLAVRSLTGGKEKGGSSADHRWIIGGSSVDHRWIIGGSSVDHARVKVREQGLKIGGVDDLFLQVVEGVSSIRPKQGVFLIFSVGWIWA